MPVWKRMLGYCNNPFKVYAKHCCRYLITMLIFVMYLTWRLFGYVRCLNLSLISISIFVRSRTRTILADVWNLFYEESFFDPNQQTTNVISEFREENLKLLVHKLWSLSVKYAETRKLSNTSHTEIRIFITDILVKIYTNLIIFFFSQYVNNLIQLKILYNYIVARFHLYGAQCLS